MKKVVIIIIVFWAISCTRQASDYSTLLLTEETPTDIPVEFMEQLTPDEMIIHKGVLNPDLSEFYYTLSDKDFNNFDVFVIKRLEDRWSDPESAFFNSDYSEHGMSFSPDGQSIFFSSTRPTHIDGIPETWHLWRSDKVDGTWNQPVFVDIPNLRDKLVSHPIITESGTLYFHSSNLDYSDMDIYHSDYIDGEFHAAIKTPISPNEANIPKCTPYVSPQEDYMLFASIGTQLDLMIAFNDGDGNWVNTKRLSKTINKDGRGNPYVTLDHKFLFYTTGTDNGDDWTVKWVNIEDETKSYSDY